MRANWGRFFFCPYIKKEKMFEKTIDKNEKSYYNNNEHIFEYYFLRKGVSNYDNKFTYKKHRNNR